jgi:hypothetical protein
MIIALQETVLNTWKLSAAFILFSPNSLHGRRLFPDVCWSGAFKSRRSPGAVVVWMHSGRQQQHWKRHLSSSPINTNKDDKVHALISDDSAYWGSYEYIGNNQGRPEIFRRSGQLNNLESRADQ